MNQNESRIRVGVVGDGRGSSMMAYCNHASHAKLVAICDKWEEDLGRETSQAVIPFPFQSLEIVSPSHPLRNRAKRG